MCWSSATRLSCAACSPISWTRRQVGAGLGQRQGACPYFSLCSSRDADFDLLSAEELPYLKCPLHTVLKLTPVAYGRAAPPENRSFPSFHS